MLQESPWLSRLPRPRTTEGTAVLAMLIVLVAAVIAMAAAPVDNRALIGGLLVGVALLAMALRLLAMRLHRAAARAEPLPPPAVVGPAVPWFSADTLAEYPARQLAPQLAALDDPPSPHQLDAAWICATHGHDITWLEHHFELPGPIARTLVAAARHRIPAD